jgi:hypothetical protein
MIKNDGNKNIMEREKYRVKSAGASLFPNFSNVNIFEYGQPRFEMIQSNDIIQDCELTGCLD